MKLTIVIAALTILATALLLMVLRYFSNTRSKVSKASLKPSLALTGGNPTANSPTQKALAAAHWLQMNGWLLEGQADDRRLMNRNVAMSAGSASAHRSGARRSHRANYKVWSKQRHD